MPLLEDAIYRSVCLSIVLFQTFSKKKVDLFLCKMTDARFRPINAGQPTKTQNAPAEAEASSFFANVLTEAGYGHTVRGEATKSSPLMSPSSEKVRVAGAKTCRLLSFTEIE